MGDRGALAAGPAAPSSPWRLLPACELGCGSPTTCWRRLTEWAKAGVFEQFHLLVLDRLDEQGQLDWEQSIVASPEASSTWSATMAGCR